MQSALALYASERVLQSRIGQDPLAFAGITLQAHFQGKVLVLFRTEFDSRLQHAAAAAQLGHAL